MTDIASEIKTLNDQREAARRTIAESDRRIEILMHRGRMMRVHDRLEAIAFRVRHASETDGKAYGVELVDGHHEAIESMLKAVNAARTSDDGQRATHIVRALIYGAFALAGLP